MACRIAALSMTLSDLLLFRTSHTSANMERIGYDVFTREWEKHTWLVMSTPRIGTEGLFKVTGSHVRCKGAW